MDHGAAETDELKPTYHGIIVSAEDMLILVEACLSNQASYVPRRIYGKERDEVARSGKVFIYEENATGIKNWVDGMSWSPRHFQNGYSLYRQVNIRGRKLQSLAKRRGIAAESNPSSISIEAREAAPKTPVDAHDNDRPLATESDATSREKLVKPKSEFVVFVEGGIFKKRMNIKAGAMTHCLVSYYSVADAEEQGKLQRPSKDPRFSGLKIRQEFLEEFDRLKSSRNRRKGKEKESLHEDRSQLHSGNALRGASNPSSPMGDAGMPALDPEDIELFLTSLKQQDPNSRGASAPESYQQGPHPHTNPST